MKKEPIVISPEQMAADKRMLIDQINHLKKKEIVKRDSDVARALNYTRGALSEMKSLTSGVPVSLNFKLKFKDRYGKHLAGYVPEVDVDRLGMLESKVRVLMQEMVGILHQLTERPLSLIAADLDEAVKAGVRK